MKDLLTSLRAQITERISSPLFGAFVLSFIAWNHKYFLVLISSADLEKKLKILDENSQFKDGIISEGIIWPAVATGAFLLAYPLLSLAVFYYWYIWKVKMKKIRDKIDGATLLTKGEAEELRAQFIEIEINHQKKIRELTTGNRNKPAIAQAEPSEQEVGEHSNAESKGVLKVLTILAKSEGQLMDYEIMKRIDEPKVKYQHYMDEAHGQGYIIASASGNSLLVKLTPKGRALVVKLGLV